MSLQDSFSVEEGELKNVYFLQKELLLVVLYIR